MEKGRFVNRIYLLQVSWHKTVSETKGKMADIMKKKQAEEAFNAMMKKAQGTEDGVTKAPFTQKENSNVNSNGENLISRISFFGN